MKTPRYSVAVCMAGVVLLANAVLALRGATAIQPWQSFILYTVAFAALYGFSLGTQANSGKSICGPGPIIIAGIVLRLLFMGYPLSDDVNRYAWEGVIQQQGTNPYVTAPIQMADTFANDPIFGGINHKAVSAIYPPVAMLVFRAVSSLRYSLWTYKWFFFVCDVLVLILLVPLIRHWRRPVHWLALYAWNPLVLLYGVGEGHLDVLYVIFLVAALLAFSHRRMAWAGFLLLGMAVMTKYLCIIFLPFLVTRDNRKHLVFFFVSLLAIIPFLAPGMTEGLSIFSSQMAYNDVIPRLLRHFFSGVSYTVSMIVVFALGYGLIWLFFQEHRYAGMLYAYVWCILCLPSVHVWYLMPLALLLVQAPNRAVLLLMTTAGLGFHVLHRQWYSGVWQESWWIWCSTYIPFALLLVRDWGSFRLPWQCRYPKPESIDILVPVHNEALHIISHMQSLQQAIDRLDSSCLRCRIYVVDGGSTDDTLALITSKAVEKCHSRLGRGTQLATGWAQSNADLVLMLHADSLLQPDALVHLIHVLEQHPGVGWGVLGHGYDASTRALNVIAWLNRIRFAVFGIAFGDQGIFFRRTVLAQSGGMPDIPLMEDVELSLRLAGDPRISLGGGLTVSARHWERGAKGIRALRIIGIVFLYLLCRRLGANIDGLAARLYAYYYDRKEPFLRSQHG